MTHPVSGTFLSPRLCAAVVEEMERDGFWRWGEVNFGGGAEVDLNYRRAQWCTVPASCDSLIATRLLSIGRSLERYFRALNSFEGPNLLRYRAGDFFRPHPDEDPRTRIRPRQVTITVSLNDQEFSGGVLRLHQANRGRPLSVAPRAGRFVAFPSRMIHEVTPITAGTRYALVAWLH
jgi:predicted 2-oxoglutarate/Fe(II)-dependent dioxygenase YbiX